MRSRLSTNTRRSSALEKRQCCPFVGRGQTNRSLVGENPRSVALRETTLYLIPQGLEQTMSATRSPAESVRQRKPTRSELGSMPSLADHETTVRQLIERGFNHGDLTVLDEVLDPTFVEHESVAPQVPLMRRGPGDYRWSTDRISRPAPLLDRSDRCRRRPVWAPGSGDRDSQGAVYGKPADRPEVIGRCTGRLPNEQRPTPPHPSTDSSWQPGRRSPPAPYRPRGWRPAGRRGCHGCRARGGAGGRGCGAGRLQ